MKVKNIVSVVLLLFVAASIVYLVAGESGSRSEQSETGSTTTVAQPAPPQAPAEVAQQTNSPQHKLVAYYFHRTQRCRTCLTIEAYAEEALREEFPEAFETGELEWQAVNIEESPNEHFVTEYELTTSTLVMVLLENGVQQRWKSLDQVWELVSDEWVFKDYVKDEALAYLESSS